MNYSLLQDKFLPFGIVLFILIISVLYIVFYFSININNNKNNIEIVVSRYNEQLQWLQIYPYNKYPVVVYNKGPNEDFEKTENIIEIINLKNEGREAHTYLYHIIKNYNNLSDVTIFLQGSIDSHGYKYSKSSRLLEEIENRKDTTFLGNIVSDINNMDYKEIQYNFVLDNWGSTDQKNSNINKETELQISKLRPFGKWHETHFQNVRNIITTGYSIFAISREDIIQHPLYFYENLIKELEGSTNPETGHYFERSWYSVFYPYKNVNLIQLEW